jgi:glycosyltransferase involved in cell wall biosynthesis
MVETLPLSIVFGFRDRDTERVDRCLASLARQTFHDFEVIFVDYGSASATARAVRSIVERYAFCRYIYTETRGYPWNRAQALNVGARLAESDYVLTSDVDMIFPKQFVQVVMDQAHPHKVLYCYHHFLPKDFSDWDHLDDYAGKLPTATRHAYGPCQCITRELFYQMRGFDEYYRYWGAEDSDMNARLGLLGLEEVWLVDKTHLFHQWHLPVNYDTREFMPEGLWGRMQIHRFRNQNQSIRNSERWGRIYSSEDRPALRFLDLEHSRLYECDDLAILDLPPNRNHSLSRLALYFWNTLPSGHAVAVDHAFYPHSNKLADRLLRYQRRALRALGRSAEIDYRPNRLHSFLVDFIEQNEDMIADYYLDFPALDGVSLLVKA